MPSIRRLVKAFDVVPKTARPINWHPGHMNSGMKAIIGKLNTVDCVIEVHDARIPVIGRNKEFRQHLGAVKPRILVLNKSDLADLSYWKTVKQKLQEHGDEHVILTDLSGCELNGEPKGYTNLMNKAVELIRNSDRNNRTVIPFYKIMIVGIPNVGKSTLINRLRQHHLGLKGEATRTGNMAGVTRKVENMVKICARPLVYSLDTPGILQPSATKDMQQAMQLALCSTINDRAVDPYTMAGFLLDYLHAEHNFSYLHLFNLDVPELSLDDLCRRIAIKNYPEYQTKTDGGQLTDKVDVNKICWSMIRHFRKGLYGRVMFERHNKS